MAAADLTDWNCVTFYCTQLSLSSSNHAPIIARFDFCPSVTYIKKKRKKEKKKGIYVCMYTYIYICVCVCIGVRMIMKGVYVHIRELKYLL